MKAQQQVTVIDLENDIDSIKSSIDNVVENASQVILGKLELTSVTCLGPVCDLCVLVFDLSDTSKTCSNTKDL